MNKCDHDTGFIRTKVFVTDDQEKHYMKVMCPLCGQVRHLFYHTGRVEIVINEGQLIRNKHEA